MSRNGKAGRHEEQWQEQPWGVKYHGELGEMKMVPCEWGKSDEEVDKNKTVEDI